MRRHFLEEHYSDERPGRKPIRARGELDAELRVLESRQPACTLLTGTTKRAPSAEATLPPAQVCAIGIVCGSTPRPNHFAKVGILPSIVSAAAR